MTPAERLAALLVAQNALDAAMAADSSGQAEDRETGKEGKR